MNEAAFGHTQIFRVLISLVVISTANLKIVFRLSKIPLNPGAVEQVGSGINLFEPHYKWLVHRTTAASKSAMLCCFRSAYQICSSRSIVSNNLDMISLCVLSSWWKLTFHTRTTNAPTLNAFSVLNIHSISRINLCIYRECQDTEHAPRAVCYHNFLVSLRSSMHVLGLAVHVMDPKVCFC